MATKKSSVDGLWDYMQERERIRLRRAAGDPFPWTHDKILRAYKFTNVQREHDRTSKVFRSIYEQHRDNAPDHVLLFNCAVARYFGTAEFYTRVGWQHNFNPKGLVERAKDMIYAGYSVFTRAYVITNGGLSMPKEEYVVHHPLTALWGRAKDIARKIEVDCSWEAGYNLLHELEGFGGTGFMAKEVLLDYLQFHPTNDWATFTPTGPGAMRGLGRILMQDPYHKIHHPLAAIQQIHAKLDGPWRFFAPLSRPLSCSDIQFNLCEYDKYERTRLGQGKPKNKYKEA